MRCDRHQAPMTFGVLQASLALTAPAAVMMLQLEPTMVGTQSQASKGGHVLPHYKTLPTPKRCRLCRG